MNMEKTTIIDVINVLAKPIPEGKCKNLKEALEFNLQQAGAINPQIKKLQSCSDECSIKIEDADDVVWKYACTCLEALFHLRRYLQEREDELLSVSQQKTIKVLLECIISMGLLPYLLPGVGLRVGAHSSSFNQLIKVNNISDIEKYYRLRGVTKGLLLVIEEKQVSGLLVSKHIEDVLGALCQLTMPLYKQPTAQLLADRDYFHKKLAQLTTTCYQPVVINALMILQGNKQCPRWLRVGISKLLTERLIEKNGVISTVKAIQHTVDYESPNVMARLESIVRLIVTPHIRDASSYYNIVIPQIIQLIYSDDVNLMRISVLCCRFLHETNKLIFDQYIVPKLFAPLLSSSTNWTEDEITQSIQGLHKCFAIPASDLWAVNIEPVVVLSKILYTIYCKICDSPVIIKKAVQDLLWAILSKTNNDMLNKILSSLLLNEKVEGIKVFAENLAVTFGDCGGIKIVADDENRDVIEYSKCILKLLEERDDSGKISEQIFITLMNYYSSLNVTELSEMKLYVTEMLAELAESEAVQKTIVKDPHSIINFIESLITNQMKCDDNNFEVLCIALVLLIAVLDCSNKFDWDKLKSLSASLPELSARSNSIELKMLCDEVYGRILTRGGSMPHAINTKSETEQALQDACDPLLPVRGHALLQLTKLIAAGDPQAKSKMNAILCIFQENLKDEDSYLYLSAIDGLSSLAVEFPDTVLHTLIEQYATTETTVRLKVGQALMRVVRRLGDMVPVYKNELLNSFLSGVRDPDNLVRASSLSNVGELCQILSFRIGPIAFEILSCVESVVTTDPAAEPRRAAVMMLTLLLRGLQSQTLNTLERALLPLYRALKKIYLTDKDDVVRLHSQLAIEELNSATVSFLFPAETLTKRIFVLDPP